MYILKSQREMPSGGEKVAGTQQIVERNSYTREG